MAVLKQNNCFFLLIITQLSFSFSVSVVAFLAALVADGATSNTSCQKCNNWNRKGKRPSVIINKIKRLHSRIRVAIFRPKIFFRGMWNKTEQTAVPSEFCLFRGREKPLNSVPNHFSEERNPRNSIPNHFSEEKNPWNSIPNHFPEEKNPRNSIPNHFWMRKTSEFHSEPFQKIRNLGIPFRIILGREKTSEFRSK